MRIVGGTWRGRTLVAPKGTATRPTTDRVREALFSALTSRLGSDLSGARVLDAFAGSGALGLEALSRGGSSATFVEKHRDASSALRRNISSLGAESRATVVTGDTFSLAARLPGGPFALILLDPPYTLDAADIGSLLSRLADSGSIQPGALIVWERADKTRSLWPDGFAVVATKRYGSTEIDIAEYEGGSGSR